MYKFPFALEVKLKEIIRMTRFKDWYRLTIFCLQSKMLKKKRKTHKMYQEHRSKCAGETQSLGIATSRKINFLHVHYFPLTTLIQCVKNRESIFIKDKKAKIRVEYKHDGHLMLATTHRDNDDIRASTYSKQKNY